jgi:broad-specificity NMP kinase
MSTTIISGFAGIGKSTFAEMMNKGDQYKVLDLESKHFSKMMYTNLRDPGFPKNYIDALIDFRNQNKYDFILISAHEEVRKELLKRGIGYNYVLPYPQCKDEYIKRYKNRGNSEDFIILLNNNWDEWTNVILPKEFPRYLDCDEYLGNSKFMFELLIS